MPSFEVTAAAMVAVAAIFQAIFAGLLLRVNHRLARLQERHSEHEGPYFKVFFNGFQAQPMRPHDEMLPFMFTVINEGRSGSRISNWGLDVLDGDPLGPRGTFPFFPFERFQGGSFSNFPDPTLPESPGERWIPPNEARMYVGHVSANGGWDRWKRVRLTAEPIGGHGGSVDIEWNLFWLQPPP